MPGEEEEDKKEVALCASCDRCRARKTKCDGNRPCGNCATKYMKKHKITRYAFITLKGILCCVRQTSLLQRFLRVSKESVSIFSSAALMDLIHYNSSASFLLQSDVVLSLADLASLERRVKPLAVDSVPGWMKVKVGKAVFQE